MSMKKKILFCVMIMLLAGSMTGCRLSDSMKDGFYTAEMSDFSHGWKEYICIQVKNDVIVSAEFNAKNSSGLIKAWDNSYMKNMIDVNKTYPNKYTREYVQQLLEGQKETKVDALTGATNSGKNFDKLVTAVIEQAKSGDSSVKIVESEPEEE